MDAEMRRQDALKKRQEALQVIDEALALLSQPLPEHASDINWDEQTQEYYRSLLERDRDALLDPKPLDQDRFSWSYSR